MSPIRRLIYDFYDLPYVRRPEVMTRIGVVAAEDGETPERDRYHLWFQRVKERDLLDEFRSAVADVSR